MIYSDSLSVKFTPDLAEEIGWHIGDGSMNYYLQRGKPKGIYQLRGHIEDDKQHYLIRIKPIFEKIYNIKVILREMPSTRVFGFQIWNDEIVDFKKQLGLPLGKKFELEIPKEFVNEKELLVSCIRGIFDTDGCLYLEKKNNKLYPRIQIVTISHQLANQLSNLMISMGLKATLYSEHDTKDYKRQIVYVITIRGVEMLHKFFREIEPKNPKHILKYNRFLESNQAKT